MNAHGETPENPILLADINGIEPRFDAVYIDLNCPACKHRFLSPQGTVGGHPVGGHICPKCNEIRMLSPGIYYEAVDRDWPRVSWDHALAIMQEASRIVNAWPQHESMQELFVYEGFTLGRFCAHSTVDIITEGLSELNRAE